MTITTTTRQSHLLALALSRSCVALHQQLIEPMDEMLSVSVSARLTVQLPHKDLDAFMELAKQVLVVDVPQGEGQILATHTLWLQWLGVEIEVRWTGALTEEQRAEILALSTRSTGARRTA